MQKKTNKLNLLKKKKHKLHVQKKRSFLFVLNFAAKYFM